MDCDFGGVVALLMASPIHRGWFIGDVERLIVPPLLLGQSVGVCEGEEIVAFASYAMLTKEAEDGFVTGHRKLLATDWNAGDRIWLMDAIAPYGHARQAMSALRDMLRSKGMAGQPIRFRRNKGGPRRYAQVTI